MSMKSSSNLISEEAGKRLSQTWMPIDFSRPASDAECPVQENPSAEFASIVGAISVDEIDPIERPPAPAVSSQKSLNSRSNVRKWQPEEVRFVTQAGTIQAAARSGEGPDHQDIREILVNDLMIQAAQILANAQAQAAEIVRQAQESAQLVLMDAEQRGWKAAETETIPMIQAVQAIIDSVQSWRDEMYAQSESAVLILVKDISQTLFCDGFTLDEEELQRTFNKVLASARSLGDLRIIVNPDDAMNLGPYWREYQVSISGQQLEIIPSDSIKRGGCFVEGEMGTVDGRVETQLNAIMEAITNTAEQNVAIR